MKTEINDIRKCFMTGNDDDAWFILLDKLEEIEDRLNKLEGKKGCCDGSCE